MRCAHCDTLITDESTIAKRDGKTFCCNNCATAYMRAQEAPDETLTTGGGRTPTNAKTDVLLSTSARSTCREPAGASARAAGTGLGTAAKTSAASAEAITLRA